MGVNLAKMKLMDDQEREIREYREYDYENEKVKIDKEAKCIILAKNKSDDAKILF